MLPGYAAPPPQQASSERGTTPAVEDADETHPYRVRCHFPGQAVPLDTYSWCSAWELVEPTRAEQIALLRTVGAWPWPGHYFSASRQSAGQPIVTGPC